MSLNPGRHTGIAVQDFIGRMRPEPWVVGFWQDADVLSELAALDARAVGTTPRTWSRFGDNMRQVAVTEG